jgi:hypothetical protein
MTLGRRLAAEALGTALLLATVIGSGIMGERLAHQVFQGILEGCADRWLWRKARGQRTEAPLSEIVARKAFGRGIPGSGPFVQHLTLWVGFLGAAIAAREGKLLALATGTAVPRRMRRPAAIFAAAVAACMATILACGAVQLVITERETGTIIAAGLPAWVGQLALPAGFALIALRRWGGPFAIAGFLFAGCCLLFSRLRFVGYEAADSYFMPEVPVKLNGAAA